MLLATLLASLVGGRSTQALCQTLCQVNDCVVRLGVLQGEFHWHKHNAEDEFFYVVEGKFVIDLEGRSVEPTPQQGFTVPKGVFEPLLSVFLLKSLDIDKLQRVELDVCVN
jgi:hypothetical protein